ncbi:MAG: putative peptidoglycan-binding domain-containing protein [Bacteroidales bacterium]
MTEITGTIKPISLAQIEPCYPTGKIKHNAKIDIDGLTFLVKEFYRHTFYHKYQMESINNGALQKIIFDWCVNSGRWGSRRVQRILNQFFDTDLRLDGIIGKNTLKTINACEPESLFNTIKAVWINDYQTIAKKAKGVVE